MKQKFSSLDVSCIVKELESLQGLRLQNIYDLSSKAFLLKFAKPDHKQYLYLESGLRMHLTQYNREKAQQMPGGFCMKLRKHLRTRRLTSVRQLGIDRVVDFCFGMGDSAYHLICEFYASGNVILTDSNYKTLVLLRVVSAEDAGTKFAVGEAYNVDNIREFVPISRERFSNALLNGADKDQIKRSLGAKLDFSSAMMEHCLLQCNFAPNMKIGQMKKEPESSDRFFEQLKTAEELMNDIPNHPEGYIIVDKIKAKPQDKSQTALVPDPENPEFMLAYQEFHPYLFAQFKNKPFRKFSSFNEACDEFFTGIEAQKLEIKSRSKLDNAERKLENVRKEHQARVKGLEEAQKANQRKAQLIELNIDVVEQAILILRSAIASRMDWQSLNELIEEEKLRRNPIALKISGLKLESNEVTILLSDFDNNSDYEFEDDSDDDRLGYSSKPEPVDIDIGLSAHANARRYYETKKLSAEKQKKTVKASSKAMKSAEKKILKEIGDVKTTPSITRARKPFWFEKFHWFISSEDYLVLGGRDAQQNEMLVKKHLEKGDIYIHADLPGSSSVIVKGRADRKNYSNNACPIPQTTLNEAGVMALIFSKAWEAKIVTSAYWVFNHQVSKTAPSGEFLTTGSFMIRGKKNFLPPAQLVYGFGLLFKIAEESIPRHLHERRPDLRSQESPAVDDEPTGDLNSTPAQEDKYNLDEYGEEESSIYSIIEALDNTTIQKPAKNRKYVSSKQRKDQKKETEGVVTSEEKLSSAAPNKSKSKTAQIPRGKKSKLKKMKQKYADQDEEEREQRLRLLGSKAIQVSTDEKDAEELNGSSAPLSEQIQEDNESDSSDKNSVTENSSITPLKKEDAFEPSKARKQAEREEIRQILEDENIHELDDEDKDQLSYLDSLTGKPLEDDLLLFAIPVCAPYSTLQTYKYKVKLVPGSTKKGKAARSTLLAFSQAKNATKSEKDLIKIIPENEALQTMLGKVKVMGSAISGGSEKGARSKSGRKSTRKK